jgi:hypothetical protein
MATPIAHKGVIAGAKVQAMTMLDILLHPGAGREGVGLFQERADEGDEVQELPASGRQARDFSESENDGFVSAADEAVLLRRVEVQHLSGAVGDQVSDGSVKPSG